APRLRLPQPAAVASLRGARHRGGTALSAVVSPRSAGSGLTARAGAAWKHRGKTEPAEVTGRSPDALRPSAATAHTPACRGEAAFEGVPVQLRNDCVEDPCPHGSPNAERADGLYNGGRRS